jgi:hypothetical protein
LPFKLKLGYQLERKFASNLQAKAKKRGKNGIFQPKL